MGMTDDLRTKKMKEKAVMPYGMVAEDLRTTLKAQKVKENAKMSNGMVTEDLRTTLKAKKIKENAKMSNGMVAEDLITTEDLRTMKIIHRKTKRKKKTTNHEFNCDVVCLAKRLV